MSEDQTIEHSGFRVKVADAIGAGDAFTACLAHHYLRGRSLEEISETANRFASWVATQTGATPPVSAGQLQDILSGVYSPLKETSGTGSSSYRGKLPPRYQTREEI